MGRQIKNNIHSFLLKLDEEDRKKLTSLISEGINMSYEFRLLIRKKFKDMYENNKTM